MSWRASSGFPPVVRAHSAQIASPISPPRPARTSSAIAAPLSGVGLIAVRGSFSISPVSVSGAAAGSPVRTARIMHAGNSSILAAR